jgi:hypothetical protein
LGYGLKAYNVILGYGLKAYNVILGYGLKGLLVFIVTMSNFFSVV